MLDAPFPVATTDSTITVEWLPVQTPSGMPMDKYEVQMLGVDVIPDPTGIMIDRFVTEGPPFQNLVHALTCLFLKTCLQVME